MAPQPPVRSHVTQGGEFGGKRNHRGLDLAASRGTDVHASFFGRVIKAGWDATYGNHVIVKHRASKGRRRETLYGHLDDITTKTGHYVNSRTVIGHAGDSGAAQGVHVHFGTYFDGVPVDPTTWIGAQ